MAASTSVVRPIRSPTSPGRQPTTYVGELPAEGVDAGQDGGRRHPVRVEVRGAEILLADLEHRHRARVSVPGHHLDDDQGVVGIEKVVGEMHPVDAVVDRADVLGQASGRGEPPDDLGTEPVVAAEVVADSGHQDARAHMDPALP